MKSKGNQYNFVIANRLERKQSLMEKITYSYKLNALYLIIDRISRCISRNFNDGISM